jgi:hypothetical protein
MMVTATPSALINTPPIASTGRRVVTVTSPDDVLAATQGLRTPDPSAKDEKAVDSAIRRIVADLISVDDSAGDLLDWTAYPAAVGEVVDGLLIDATTYAYASGATRTRSIIACVPVDGASSLSGTIELRASGASLHRAGLSGDVFVSSPIDTTDAGPLEVLVADNVPRPAEGQPAPAAPVPRTAAEKAAAKAAYDAALKKARKKYAKAAKKAGSSKRKKSAAKKTYAKRRATATARYRAAVADVPSAPAAAAPAEQRVFRTVISTDTGWVAVA